jgi:glycine/D-amino acid oxidase-like deaminating enzyme
MLLTNGNIYWTKKDKINKKYEYLSSNIKCDVLIVGGGISGAITAYYMAKKGLNVVVIEKNIIGYGSTAATTALLEYQVDIDLYKLDKIIGKHNAKRIYELCLKSIKEIENIVKEINSDCDFEIKDAVYFTNKLLQRGSIIKEYEERKKAGFDVYFEEKNESLDFNCCIRTKNGSAVINPYKFTCDVFNYLSKFPNVKIYENTRLDNVEYKEKIKITTNNNFVINTDKIIFCTGFETLKYIKTDIVELYKTFTIVTKPIKNTSEFDFSFTARDMCEPYHYIRFTKDNRILFGGEDIKITNKMIDLDYINNISSDKYSKLYKDLCRIFNIKEIDIDYSFSGTFANTKDTLPIIDEIDGKSNTFVNLGYGANGILYSVIGAKILKDAVDGLYTKDISMFRINR